MSGDDVVLIVLKHFHDDFTKHCDLQDLEDFQEIFRHAFGSSDTDSNAEEFSTSCQIARSCAMRRQRCDCHMFTLGDTINWVRRDDDRDDVLVRSDELNSRH